LGCTCHLLYRQDKQEESMLQKINKSKLSYFKNLNHNLLHKLFDPDNYYLIYFIYGAIAIGVNIDAIEPTRHHHLG
jgi:spermidine/putrescine transport system substrate-binding protein